MVMRCRHSQDRASTPSALRTVKPQRAHRITESCYFYLSPPLCLLCLLWFSKKPYFENIKKSLGFWSPQREITQASTTESLPKTSFLAPAPLCSRALAYEIHHADACSGLEMVFRLFPDRKHLHVPDQTPRSPPSTSRILCKIYKCVRTIIHQLPKRLCRNGYKRHDICGVDGRISICADV